MSFEKDMERIEQIVHEMETNKNLDDSLKLFKEGSALIKNCQKDLDASELEVKKVIKSQDSNKPELQDI